MLFMVIKDRKQTSVFSPDDVLCAPGLFHVYPELGEERTLRGECSVNRACTSGTTSLFEIQLNLNGQPCHSQDHWSTKGREEIGEPT